MLDHVEERVGLHSAGAGAGDLAQQYNKLIISKNWSKIKRSVRIKKIERECSDSLSTESLVMPSANFKIKTFRVAI
jgi:hypothetical protein